MKILLSKTLSANYGGIAVVIICLVCALGLQQLASVLNAGPVVIGVRIVAMAIAFLAAIFAIGTSYQWLRTRQFFNQYPAPGKLIDIGYCRMHILAEGEQTDLPAVIWIPGSHDAGISMAPFHNAFKSQTRSILYDRAGSGWSDNGPFPRTVVREVHELASLLSGAKQNGPFVIVAHSFGGLVATNFASLYPEKVAGLMLMDIACPDLYAYTASLPGSKTLGDGWALPWMAMLGVLWHRQSPFDTDGIYNDEEHEILAGFHAQARTHVNFVSALDAINADPLGTVNTPAALGDLPLRCIIPQVDSAEYKEFIRPYVPYLSEFQLTNLVDLTAAARAKTAQLSRRGELRYSPENTGHSFPVEVPEFVLEELRDMLQTLNQ